MSVRLAYAMLALDPEDRDSFANLLFSILTKKLGDIRLSSLMTMANLTADDVLKQIHEVVGEDAKGLPFNEVLKRFIKEMTEGMYSNYGNLRPTIPEDQIDEFDPDSPPSPRKLK